MIFINEWLPNPVGPDAAGEFIELYNSGGAAAGLNGWFLKTEKDKKFLLAGRSIPAHGYLLLRRSVTKLPLRNADGELSLYAPNGTLADRGSFPGSAPERKSFSRVDYQVGPAQHFAFVDPTPDAANKTVGVAVMPHIYPVGTILNHELENSGFFGIMMGTASLIAGLIFYVTKTHEDLSKLFFGRDEEIW